MIRFYENRFFDKKDMDFIISLTPIIFNENIWDNGKGYFKQNLCYDVTTVQMIPIEKEEHAIICYAYQDEEANRELRMLKELEEKLESDREVLQFKALYPEIQQVIVCGCNELAYRFVKYLEKQQVAVSVVGKYWDYFGYKNESVIDLDGADKLVIYAEGVLPKTGDFYQTVIRSVSSEFECIDKIYEANVVENKIKDTYGDFEAILKKLKTKEVIILGTDAKAQDAYDLLYSYDIDICCFADWNVEKADGERYKTLLGKKIRSIADILDYEGKTAIINCADRHSALGTKDIEFFDYYGYKRNEDLFFLQDYIDIPHSNLIHVLKGKTVKLVGEEKLCRMLADYLNEIEQSDIDVKYMELSQYMMQENDILCSVYPWYGAAQREDNPKLWDFREKLAAKDVSYTNYFSRAQAFILIDLYRNRNGEKYSIKQLTPKGILLGRIPVTSGNFFFRGILDGHPDILKWDYTALDDNLFLYCFRLSGEKAENILKVFKKMYDEEFAAWRGADFTDWNKFEKSAKKLLSLKNNFTSQELFVIFYLSYTEMMRNERITDIERKVIYWEPHSFPREDYPFLAKWLESGNINGQTIYMHRDHIIWTGSYYKFYKKNPSSVAFIQSISADEMAGENEVSYEHWEEFHVRFEDVKLHPHKELSEICVRLGIPWSDTMLKTTRDGETWDFGGISDFDLKPVFNKYEETLSEFDRFRISLISNPYQKKYGYTYENSMRFSRRKLWEMFLEKFRFQQKLQFANERDRTVYYLRVCESLRWQLWKTRKHEILDDIVPRFKKVEIGEIIEKQQLEDIKKLIRQEKRIVMYGIGKDCEGILASLNDADQEQLIFCDAKALDKEIIFHGKKVISPKKLCEDYKNYKILITSSWYYKSIQYQLEEMGIDPKQITCNKICLWGEKNDTTRNKSRNA